MVKRAKRERGRGHVWPREAERVVRNTNEIQPKKRKGDLVKENGYKYLASF